MGKRISVVTADVTPEAQAAASTATAQAALAQGYAAQLAAGVASPAGTYANLTALNTDNPDNGKIYITLDDGNWCYHNGTAFVAGGAYQAASVVGKITTLENVSGIKWDYGYIEASGNIVTGIPERSYSGLMCCVPGDTASYISETNHVNISGIAFYSKSGIFISGIANNGAKGTEQITIVPENAYFCRLSTDAATLDKSYVRFSSGAIPSSLRLLYGHVDTSLSQVNAEILKANNQISEHVVDYENVDVLFTPGYYVTHASIIIGVTDWETKKTANGESIYTESSIDLGESAVGKFLSIKTSKYYEGSSRIFGFCDENDVILSYYRPATARYVLTKDGYYTCKIPIISRYFFMSEHSENSIISVDVLTYSKNIWDLDIGTAFVSPNGSDSNRGTSSSPYLTVNHALEEGASNILLMPGVYDEVIDLSKAMGRKEISLSSYDKTGRVVFMPSSSLISESETKTDGYTKVYQCATDKTFDENNVWIFQDGVMDAATLITDAERHSLQRGYEYRCHDTKIARCTSTVLATALTEIDEASEFKWFIDGTTLYFSRPEAITAEKPLRGCSVVQYPALFYRADRGVSIKMSGIETKYMPININNTKSSVISDCASKNVYSAGAFTYDGCLSAQFIRCEAARCFIGGGGDGFNGHGVNTGDKHSKQTTATFIDCWSHDNNDDGISDHERCESTVIGGLYEYNKKGDVTPAYGSHCSCYNVYSRKNHNGFYYTGSAEVAEGGMYGQMLCFGCIAENNDSADVNSSGFRVNGLNNSMFLSGCKSIGNKCGYTPEGATNLATLIDCGGVDNGTLKGGYGTHTIKNTTLVT